MNNNNAVDERARAPSPRLSEKEVAERLDELVASSTERARSEEMVEKAAQIMSEPPRPRKKWGQKERDRRKAAEERAAKQRQNESEKRKKTNAYQRRYKAERLARMSAEEREVFERRRSDYQRRYRAENKHYQRRYKAGPPVVHAPTARRPGDRSSEEGVGSKARKKREHDGKGRSERPAKMSARERWLAGMSAEEREKIKRRKNQNQKAYLARMSPEEREELKRKQRDYSRRYRAENHDGLMAKQQAWRKRKREEFDGKIGHAVGDSGATKQADSTIGTLEGIARHEDGGRTAEEPGRPAGGCRERSDRADGPGENYDRNLDEGNRSWKAHQLKVVIEAAAGGERNEEWDALVRASLAIGTGGDREARRPEAAVSAAADGEAERRRREEWDALVRASLAHGTRSGRPAAGRDDRRAGVGGVIRMARAGVHAGKRSNETSHVFGEKVENADGIVWPLSIKGYCVPFLPGVLTGVKIGYGSTKD